MTNLDAALKLYSCAQPTGQDMHTALERLIKTLRLDIQSVLYMGSRNPCYPDGSSAWFHASEVLDVLRGGDVARHRKMVARVMEGR